MTNPGSLSVHNLRQLAQNTQPPLDIHLSFGGQDQIIHCTKIIRLLPGKRITAIGTWKQTSVVIKCFFDVSKWKRHTKRELDGHHALMQAHLCTPDLISYGYNEHLKHGFAVYEYLNIHQSLYQQWQQAGSKDEKLEVLGLAMQTIASLHNAGLNQTNIRLENFLHHQNKVYIVDCSNIVKSPHRPLPANNSENNLAQFFANLTVDIDPLIPELLNHYCMLSHVNSSLFRNPDSFRDKVFKQRYQSWQRHRSKLTKSSQLVHVEKSTDHLLFISRSENISLVHQWKKEPDQGFFETTEATPDQSQCIHQPPWLITRYHTQSSTDWLKNQFRTSAAYNHWIAAHTLLFFGIKTPPPVAMYEHRLALLKGRAYYICRLIKGVNVLEYLTEFQHHPELALPVANRLLALLRNLRTAHISIGNISEHSFLVQNKEVYITRLETAKLHTSASGFRNAHCKDLQRFKKIWQQTPSLLQLFEPELDKLIETA